MAEYTLKVRRYQPESGEGPYWEEFKVELDPSLSVLDGLLQAKDRDDGSLSVRCSCRAAICGSCGMKINGQSGLGCKTQIGEAQALATKMADAASKRPPDAGARSRDAGDDERDRAGAEEVAIVVEPMGNMPVIKDLITDMESTHWTKIRRVTPWLLPARSAARARVHRRAGIDDRHHPVDGLHPVRRLRLLLPLDGSRPRLHRPRRAGQGLPLRRRPARRRDRGAPPRPRRGPARDLRLHPLLQLHRRLPEGRRADGPDHAPAPHAPARRGSRTPTAATTTRSPSSRSSRRRGRSTSRCCCRSPSRRG